MKKISIFLPVLSIVLWIGCGGNGGNGGDCQVKIKSVVVKKEAVNSLRSYSGTIEETVSTALSFATAGTIETFPVQEGQMVAKGQVIGVLDAATHENYLVSARSAVKMAEESLSQAQDAYERMSALHDAGSLPEMQWIDVLTKLAQAKSSLQATQAQEKIAERNMQDTQLKAPFSGFIASKSAETGQNVVPGMAVVRLVSIDKVKAKFSVPDNEITGIGIGQTVTVNVDTPEGGEFDARVTEKSVSGDAISRCYSVWAEIDNNGGKLLPGMICNVSKAEDGLFEAVLLPADIIQIDTDNMPFVWRIKNGKAVKTPVSLGANAGEKVCITDGLDDGDEVITAGSQKVSAGMSCTAIK